tara:strand:+ start:1299 stop:3017 length:1719 start_codon:yes stop_codon:yes gene_type:complete
VDKIRIGTRKSQLALWQARKVSDLLKSRGLRTEIVSLSSGGDRSLGGDLSSAVGQFIHSIDAELKNDNIDIAVHSAKDVPVTYQEGICNLAYLERGCTNDLLIFNDSTKGLRLKELLSTNTETSVDDALEIIPMNGMVGSVSGRRQSFVLSRRPDVIPISARGDIETRLSKLKQGRFDAIILAEIGIKRLSEDGLLDDNFLNLNAYRIEEKDWPTAPGQGAIAVHCKTENREKFREVGEILNHKTTRVNVENERLILQQLGGGCLFPCGINATGSQINATIAPSNWREVYSVGMSFPLIEFEGEISSFNVVIENQRIAQIESSGSGPKIVSTLNSDRLSRNLILSGINVVNLPVLDLEPLANNWPSEFIDTSIPKNKWPFLVLTSPFAARCAVEIAKENKDISRLQWIAIGEGTARACFKQGVTVSLCAKSRNSEELFKFLDSTFDKSTEFLLPRSSVSKDNLVNNLKNVGFNVTIWTGYRNKSRVVDECDISGSDVLLLSSPSSAKSWEENGLPIPRNILCMGQTTKEAVESTPFFAGSKVEALQGPTSEFLKMWWNQRRSVEDESSTKDK